MPITPGHRLGPYEITAKIGEGGMGEVYQATDTKLKRSVVIKVLPDSVAGDAERLARFQREAETLAALNHPGIAAIYGLEDSDGTKALVMELVEGPTLADRIAQGAIPVDEALFIAKQIAEALEGAHEQGIIHRDLKPANIKLRPDGTVKVFREQSNLDTGDNIGLIDLENSGEPVWLLNDAFDERNVELSPNGRWMAYQSNESEEFGRDEAFETFEIYVRSFPNVGDDRVQVFNARGWYPLWSRDGRELFYLETGSGLPTMMSVEIDSDGPVFAIGSRTRLFDFPYRVGADGRTYDVSPDGQRFLVLKGSGTDALAAPRIVIVQNWFTELERLVPTD